MASVEHRVGKTGESWRVVWRQELNGVRKQQMTFPDLDQAQRFKLLVENCDPHGDSWPPGYGPAERTPVGLTFAKWGATAIERRTRANERTKADYRRDLDRHFDTLATVPLIEIDTGHVARWIANRKTAGLSDKTIRNLHGFASSLFVDALAQHPPLAAHNPFASRMGELAAVRTEEMVFLNPQEFAIVLGHVLDEYRPLIRLLFGTGLRFGEATALTARDVDLLGKRKTLTVTKAWKRTGTAEWVIGEPKTAKSRRTLSLSPELVELLTPLWAIRQPGELMFTDRFGRRLPHTEVYKRGWAPAVARANVCDTHYEPQRDGRNQRPRLPKPCDCDGVLGKTPRIHDLRHSFASNMLSEGIRLEVISRLMGHSSVTITFDRYSHLDPGNDEQINAAVDRLLASR